jgi:hypothetical protein
VEVEDASESWKLGVVNLKLSEDVLEMYWRIIGEVPCTLD